MDRMFCCSNKKVVPVQPILPSTITLQSVIPEVEKKNKPYGYIRLFAGVKTGENTYTTPIISLHTYNRDQKQIRGHTATVFSAPTQGTAVGPTTSTNKKKQEIDENVRCIPIEDIISISYSTDIKKEYETIETRRERLRPPKPKLSCCGEVKQCCVETFCRFEYCPCDCCRAPPPTPPQFDTSTQQNVTAKRMILIHVEVLSEQKQKEFYEDNFHTDKTEFYLVNNADSSDDDFALKSHQAEELVRVITQLRNMKKKYPSPRELEEILQQHQTALYGNEIEH